MVSLKRYGMMSQVYMYEKENTMPLQHFDQYPLSDELKQALEALHFHTPTPVQRRDIIRCFFKAGPHCQISDRQWQNSSLRSANL